MKRFALLVALAALAGCHRLSSVPKVSLAEMQKEVDPAVRFVPAAVADKDNGWLLFLQALDSMANRNRSDMQLYQLFSEITATPPNLKNLDKAEACLLPYRKAFAALGLAASKKLWSAPIGASEYQKKPHSRGFISKSIKLERALAVSAWAGYHSGNRKAMIDSLVLQFQLGKGMIRAHHGGISTMSGLLALSTAWGMTKSLYNVNALSTDDLKALALEVNRDDLGHDYAASLKAEFLREFVQRVANVEYPTKYGTIKVDGSSTTIEDALVGKNQAPFDRRATVREASRIFAAYIKNAASGGSSGKPAPPAPNALSLGWPQEIVRSGWPLDKSLMQIRPIQLPSSLVESGSKKLSKAANPIGQLIIAQHLPLYLRMCRQITDASFIQRNMQIWLAMRIYERENGKPAASVRDLVAKGYLKSVPINPRTGKPFQLSEVI